MLKRLHPTMTQRANELDYGSQIINASEYDDVQELLAASDVLISDYSSIISEFSIMEKPVFLYAEDIKDYEQERDFYIDYFKLPYLVSENESRLLDNISRFNRDVYINKLNTYFNFIGNKETGIAARTVVDEIYKYINKLI